MKYIDLPKPHGFLIWRGKQTAIASPTPLSVGEKMLVISDGEPYGEAVLGLPVAVNLSGLADLQDSHCVRPEDRKLYWPNADKFFVYKFKAWTPYEEYIPTGKTYDNEEVLKRVLPRRGIEIQGDEAEVLDLPEPSDEQQRLLEQVERLPKTLILLDEAVSLEDGKAVYCSGVDCSKLDPVLKATLEDVKSADSLPLYQLALVRIPRLAFREKKSSESEKAMPYSKVKRDDEWCVIQSDTEEVQKCYDNEEEADSYLAALRANVDESKSVKELIAEARKCYYEGSAMPITGPVTFAELDALEVAREQAQEAQELTWQFQMLSSNIFNSQDVEDKAAALASLAAEYGSLVGEAVKGGEVEEDSKTEEVDTDSKVGKRLRQSMKDKLKQAWATLKELVDWAEPMDEEMMAKELDFSNGYGVAVKQVAGEYWHFAWSTNAFEDRENEIFSTKSLEQYVDEAQEKGDMGFFNLWHIGTKENPGLTDFAEIKWQAVIGRILVEAGPYLNDEKGQAAKAYFMENPDGDSDIAPEGWGSSPEYRYLPEERKTKVYSNIWKTRTSTLPRLAAANIWTKGTTMALSDQQKQAAVKIFGEELTAKIVKGAEDATKELEEAGVAHKEVTTTTEEVKVELPIAEVANEVVKLIDLAAFGEALTLMGQQLVELQGEIKALKQTEAIKANEELPRMVWSFVQRASNAKGTEVAEDDALKSQKPLETQGQPKTGAAAFFPAK